MIVHMLTYLEKHFNNNEMRAENTSHYKPNIVIIQVCAKNCHQRTCVKACTFFHFIQ